MNRFTLWGAWNYDPTLFDDVVVPDTINKEDLIDCIMKECGDLKPYYQQPAFLKRNITRWFRRMYWNIDRMMEAFTSEFNPVENYDRYEDRSTSESESSYHSMSTTASESMSTATSASDSMETIGSESEWHDVSAFNNSGYSPADQNRAASMTGSHNRSDSSNRSARNSYGNQLDRDNRYRNYGETAHIHGNIGVTEATTMIVHAIEMYEDIDVYNLIAHMFEKEFLVQVY